MTNLQDVENKITSPGLKRIIISAGASLVDFGDVSPGLVMEMRHLTTAVSIAVRHHPVEIIKTQRVMAYSHQLYAVDKKLVQIQKLVVSLLKGSGYKYLAIPPDTMRSDGRLISKLYSLFPHKTAATCSGLGWIGKSGLLINKNFGPRLSWSTILTNAPLDTAVPVNNSRCGSCKSCVNICPAGAIEDREWFLGTDKPTVDYKLCGEYLEKNRKALGKAICGLCIMICPRGGKLPGRIDYDSLKN